MIKGNRYLNFMLLAVSLPACFSGCSVKRLVSGAVSDLTTALYQQQDVCLARDGSASFLLVTDSIILRNPDDAALLLGGVQVYSAYATAFLLGTNNTRAFLLLDRARDYGFRAWELQFGWKSVPSLPVDDWHKKLMELRQEDIAYLFWTANAWASWITVHPESVVAIADLPYVKAALDRVIQLDESFQNGSAHLFFGMYYAVQPAGIGRDLEKSETHFKRAIELAGPNSMLPRVLYARYYARAAFDIDLFTRTLQEVLAFPSKSPDPNLNLMNAIARERAAVFLKQTDDLF